MFLVVGLLTLAFLVLYGLGAWQLFDSVGQFDEPIQGVDARTVAGATVQGLAMFATLFLGTILAVFLTLGAVRGDAERGLLQPVLVRPVRRRTRAARPLRRRRPACAWRTSSSSSSRRSC